MFSLTLTLPEWIATFLEEHGEVFPSVESRMKLVINLANANILHQTGGPFGAAIFEKHSGRLISVGVNRVVVERCSIAHAEMMAIMMAQKKLGTFDLGSKGLVDHELVTSSQMCAMCFGAVPWSGVRRVIYGACAIDAEHLAHFDEGPMPADWKRQLEKRGIEVLGEILRKEACKVLADYSSQNGIIYNGRQG